MRGVLQKVYLQGCGHGLEEAAMMLCIPMIAWVPVNTARPERTSERSGKGNPEREKKREGEGRETDR